MQKQFKIYLKQKFRSDIQQFNKYQQEENQAHFKMFWPNISIKTLQKQVD